MLVKCLECGKEVSDKATKCTNCAYSLKRYGLKFREHKKVVIVAIVSLITIIIVLSSFYIYSENKYNSKINLLSIQILGSSADCETLANLTADVWYNTIYEKSKEKTNKYTIKQGYYKEYKTTYNKYEFNSDFNTSLYELFIDKSQEIDDINKKAEDIKRQVKELENKPLVEKDLYNALLDFYNNYQELVKIATNPTGSYTEYTKNKNEKIQNGLSAYERLSTLLPIEK